MCPISVTADSERFADASSALLTEDPCADPRRCQDDAGVAVGSALDGTATRAVEEFRTGQRPWLVVSSGLDLNGLPDTPTGFGPVEDRSWWPLGWFTVGLMSLAGTSLVSYACENDGAAFVNLVAMPAAAGEVRTAEKSMRAMRGHTDAVSFPFVSEFALGGERHSPAPDLLVLACLRNPSGTPTRLASLGRALELLSDEEVAALEEPWFDIKPQKTFATDAIQSGRPLVSRCEPEGLAVRFSHSSVVASADSPAVAGGALARLAEVLPGLYQDVSLQPGQVCLVHNRLVIHGRGSPEAEVGGLTRWLLRTYGWNGATTGNRIMGGSSHLHV